MTAKIKLNAASGGGSFSLQAPSSSSNNRVLTLPDSADGTVAKTSDISFTSYALICDSKGNNTDGGTFTSGAWRTRDLNQEISDEDSIVSISSNQFTLGAGSYLIKFRAPAVKVDFHVTKLILITAGVSSFSEKAGSSEYTGGGVLQTVSFGVARVTLTGSGAFEIQHQASVTKTTDGFGQPSNGYANESIYTTVEIYKES
tara:strand:- start:338 stop:940 length:603 start_codon:yes stop_codon:yes gene_type:complete